MTSSHGRRRKVRRSIKQRLIDLNSRQARANKQMREARTAIAETIAQAITGTVSAPGGHRQPGEPCPVSCPACVREDQARADAATARRLGGLL